MRLEMPPRQLWSELIGRENIKENESRRRLSAVGSHLSNAFQENNKMAFSLEIFLDILKANIFENKESGKCMRSPPRGIHKQDNGNALIRVSLTAFEEKFRLLWFIADPAIRLVVHQLAP